MAELLKIKLGVLIKPVGLEGDVRLAPEEGIAGLVNPDVLFELRGDRYFPWFLQSWRALEDGHLLVRLEELDSPEKAKSLCGKTLWIREDQVEWSEEADGRDDLIGYEVRDAEGTKIGVCEDIVDNSGQWLAVVTFQNREVFIPLAEENILAVHDQERYLMVEIPDGLLDL
ncbi:MAG: 16S rRNA processing protein RimM [Bacteroidetes bacterium]|nr:16S rRNA processing protein RimM [Bacteroidota bacterium]